MTECLFCKIRDGQIPAKIVGENEHALAFRDLAPQAPTHILIIPRKHLSSLADADASDETGLGAMHLLAAKIAVDEKLLSGYRTVVNTGADAGQSVFHLHMHLLGGRKLAWPPG